jgi:hypothetical protein
MVGVVVAGEQVIQSSSSRRAKAPRCFSVHELGGVRDLGRRVGASQCRRHARTMWSVTTVATATTATTATTTTTATAG